MHRLFVKQNKIPRTQSPLLNDTRGTKSPLDYDRALLSTMLIVVRMKRYLFLVSTKNRSSSENVEIRGNKNIHLHRIARMGSGLSGRILSWILKQNRGTHNLAARVCACSSLCFETAMRAKNTTIKLLNSLKIMSFHYLPRVFYTTALPF